MITVQALYGGVKFPMPGPSMMNVERLDRNARPLIHSMMQRGLQVDLAHFGRMEKLLIEDMDRLTEEVRAETGVYTNLDSSPQVSELLFKKLGLKQARLKLTKSGQRESVENEVLVAIQHEHPVVSKILDFKELSKLKGTYVSPMPKLARKTAFGQWRMFPKLGDTRVPSGRLNCKEPNLLAMPNRTERGRQICEGFITDESWVFVSVDESQIEPRVVAHRSQDEALRQLYLNKEDIYSHLAITAFKLADHRFNDQAGWHYPGVDKKRHRFPAKTCTLAAIYEVSPVGLQEQMPVMCANCQKESMVHDCGHFQPLWTEDACQDLLNAFYLTYPGILRMRKADHTRARTHGLVWDSFGRILHVTAVRSVLEWVVAAALREASNFAIQSTAQGSIKLTMAAVHDDLVASGMVGTTVHPLLQIHDEILAEVREDVAEEYAEHVKWRFQTCLKLDVPIEADWVKAHTWGHLQALK
jgi:DNA polymerase-1